MGYFEGIAPIRFDPDGDGITTFRHYDADEVLGGRTMAEHLRFAVAWWHGFAWPGGDPFGGQTFERPWFGDTMDHARAKADAAFDLFAILGQPYFCWHDADIRPEGDDFAQSRANLEAMIDHIGGRMEETGTKCLWGTANLFSHRRFMAGAATNPDPDVFAYAAATVKACIDGTHRLGGENYVLWGGREGYETLLNTDLKREREQAGRFLSMVVDYARKVGFDGTILIEPKPQEPTKHQYDYDVATVYGFLKDFGLEAEVKVNVEQGHAILAGHSFEHELALASALGIFGSIDMNRNDYQSGWDTDQFPNSVPEVALAYYEVLRAGGFTTGGTNFDAKLRRQSLDPIDLVAAHVGAMDVCARGLRAAHAMLEDGVLEDLRAERYAGWDEDAAAAMLSGTLEQAAARVEAEGIEPRPRSGRQERLEAIVNRYV
ncbi:xylose isomerase [Jannaschia sp. Os4]|uniref:xylose isomerase n=1 Tax=Jannaschia sp. Os4 TaxID=2807617 RepID=UPI001939C789|nr:xylose isomerase [Jannaschia sp. Os4]MBM2575201.1 xylose isomerase [Jannaschia sp. Os4]